MYLKADKETAFINKVEKSMKKLKLRTKIIVILLGVTVFTAASMGFTSYFIFLKVMHEHARQAGLAAAQYNAEKIEAWGREKIASLQRTAAHISNIDMDNRTLLQQMLCDAADADPLFFSVFMGLDNGDLIDGKGWVPPEGYDATQRPWYQSAAGDHKVIFTPVYLDKNKNKLVTSIALPIESKHIRGVLAGNMPIDQILDRINEIRYGKTGYGVLIDSNDRVISHPDERYILKPVKEIFAGQNMTAIDSLYNQRVGVTTISLQGKKQFMVHVPIPSCGWKLLLFAPQEEFQEPANRMLKLLFVILASFLMLMIILGYVLGRRISKPIEGMIDSVTKFARGDLTEDLDIITQDELGALGDALNKMRKNLIGIIQGIQHESDLLHRHAQELTRSIEEISDGIINFISLLSHDIKTPLTLIKGYAKGIQLGIIKNPKKIEEYLNGIITRAEQIEKISSDILDCVYEVKKSLILKKRYMDLRDFAFDLYKEAKLQIESSDRVFEGNLDVKKGQLYIDEIKCIRVWNNLIANAIKYSDKQSKIKVFIKQTEDKLFCSITDEGVGIQEDELEKIFDMFYRSQENQRKGYGLGLAISKAIIEAHEGKITVASKYGEGSTFTFYIPICH